LEDYSLDLKKLYRDKAPSSSLTDTQLEKELTWLEKRCNFSAESIFFSINYASKYYPSELEDSVRKCLINNRTEMMKYFNIAKAKRDRVHVKRSESEYDQRNTFEGKNTPSWFRKSFDSNLFK
jgi:hypothetical protein